MNVRFMVRLLGAGLLFISSLVCKAQSYHVLTSKDFAGQPNDIGYAAYTNCYVSYSYQPTRHNGYYYVSFDVRLYLNSNQSWIRFNEVKSRDMLADILKHEQGHYNIAYLMRNELYTVFTSHRYSANYQNEIALLFRQVENKYHKLNEDYEAQTQHMTNVVNQQKWNNWFSKQLGHSEIAYNGSN